MNTTALEWADPEGLHRVVTARAFGPCDRLLSRHQLETDRKTT